MKRPLRFGILGCARICRRGMIPGIQQSGVATLAAIASRDAQTAASWAAEFGVPKHYDSYAALLSDPDIDAVYIPSPNELHRPWTMNAAAAGKHVLCEKPLARNLAEAKEMVDACQQHGVLLMEAFMWRHHPRVKRAREMIASRQIGELRLVKMDFSFQISDTDWRLDPTRGGGPLFDLGCYGINAARLFTGAEPTEIHARSRFGPTGIDMTTGFQLQFASGVIGLMDCSFECPYRNRIEVVGTRASLELPEGVLPPPEAKLIVRSDQGVEEIHFPESQQYAEQVRAFFASVADGRLRDPAEDGLANMTVLDKIARQIGLPI